MTARGLVILATCTAVALAACVVASAPKSKQPPDDRMKPVPVEVKLLAALRETDPYWVSLESLVVILEETPDVVAAAALHPSVQVLRYQTGRSYYRLKQ